MPLPALCQAQTDLQALLELLLLFVDYAEAEIYFIRFFKVWFHAHDLRKGFLCMLERAITVVKDSDTVPKFGLLKVTMVSMDKVAWSVCATYLRIRKMVEGLLVCRVRLLKIIHHEVTVTCGALAEYHEQCSLLVAPRLLQTSPLVCSSLRICLRYSTAAGN